MDSGHIDTAQFYTLLSSLSSQPVAAIHKEFERVAAVNYDTLKIVENLRTHYKIGLLSNAPSKIIRAILREHSLEPYFDEIVVSSEVGHIKPSKEIFEIILQRLALTPQETLFIDDSPHHTQGAEKIGIQSIVFTGAPQLKQALQELGLQLA